jgi:hypothetical protein
LVCFGLVCLAEGVDLAKRLWRNARFFCNTTDRTANKTTNPNANANTIQKAVLASAEQRLGALGARADEYGLEVTKLQSRAAAAHEEMTRGASKLK